MKNGKSHAKPGWVTRNVPRSKGEEIRRALESLREAQVAHSVSDSQVTNAETVRNQSRQRVSEAAGHVNKLVSEAAEAVGIKEMAGWGFNPAKLIFEKSS